MITKSFRVRVLAIFVILIIVLFSLALYIINTKYEQLSRSATALYSSRVVKSISVLLQSVQIERGLSGGYTIAMNEPGYKTRLLKRQKITDINYKSLSILLKNKKVAVFIQQHDLDKLKNLQYNMNNIQQIRQNILTNHISFNKEFQYYTQVNTDLLAILRNFTLIGNKNNDLDVVVYDIQSIKEILAMSRGYIYDKILSNNFNRNTRRTIEKLLYTKSIYQKDFLTDTNQKDLKIYHDTIHKHLQGDITTIINHILKHGQTNCGAQKWFKLNSQLLDEYQHISFSILSFQMQKITEIYKKTKLSLVIIITILLISSILILILLYFLHLLIKNEETNKIELKMLSHMFNSNEAMIIADANGNTLRVNNAFTKITGYTQEEMFGKSPRILNSSRHSKGFFKNMWESLLTKGSWSGEIYNKRKNQEIYPIQLSITAIKNDNGQITNYIATCIDIFELKRAKDDATYQAYHDFLTKLPNRKFMLKKLTNEFEKAKRIGFIHAFLFIDLDGFKNINDTFGHEVGDKLLIQVSSRLKQNIRENDFVARLGGDEFAVILLNLNGQHAKSHIQAITTKIIQEISKTFQVYNHFLQIGASIGIEIFPGNLDNIDVVINNADTAMYEAKHNGKNQFIFYLQDFENS